jgi:carbonic anhydrase
MKKQLIPVLRKSDIPKKYQKTPIGLLLEYHNLDREFEVYEQAEILVGMCMDNRKHLHIPDNFAFIIRTGGANLRYSDFKVSFAIAIGGVSSIVLIAHNHCGMVNIPSRKDQFIKGLVKRGGWKRQQAEEYFLNYCTVFEIGNEIDFIKSEAIRLRERYPKIVVAPMFYQVEDRKLYLVSEE